MLQKPESIRLTEAGHQKELFLHYTTLSFDIQWSDRPGDTARLTQRTDGSAQHIRYASGTQTWWDRRNVWVLPAPGDTFSAAQARYDLRAWHYFACLPYKLRDPGVQFQPMPDRTLDGRPCAVGRLTFRPGTGDTPDDWFAVFTDREAGLLRAAAFITTLDQYSVEAASKVPQMIRYRDYKTVAGIPVAHSWIFTVWQTESLDRGRELRRASLSDIRFGAADSVFVLPAAARKM